MIWGIWLGSTSELWRLELGRGLRRWGRLRGGMWCRVEVEVRCESLVGSF